MREMARLGSYAVALGAAIMFLACGGGAAQVSDPGKAPVTPGASADADADADGDKIADKDDKCPNDPEDINGYQDTDGCPDCRRQIHAHPPSIKVFEKIYFDSGAIKLKPMNQAILDSYAQIMAEHTDVRVVEVQGHADKSEQNAQQLSQQRAQSVLDELVKRGVDRSRLKAVGYATARAVAAGTTPEELAKSRRVEVTVLEQDKPQTTLSATAAPPCQ